MFACGKTWTCMSYLTCHVRYKTDMCRCLLTACNAYMQAMLTCMYISVDASTQFGKGRQTDMYAQHEHWCWHACTYPWMTMLTCMYISMVEIFGSHNLASVINTYMWTMTCMCTLLCLLNAQFGKGRQCRRNTSIDIGDVLLTCMYLSVHATSLVKSGNVYAGKLKCIRRQTYMYTPASLHVYATSIDLMFNVLICYSWLAMLTSWFTIW